MDKKIWLAASLISTFFLASCACFDGLFDWDSHGSRTAPAGTAPAPVTPVFIPPSPSSQLPADDNEFINYRETNANYREFGERAQSDQRIVSAGAGSNMSASVPPTIDEEEINKSDEDSDDSGISGDSASEDPVEDWLAEEGSTLKSLLTEWSERSGWRLIWNTNRNYTLAAGAMFRGRFADVSSALIRSFARARPAPVATFYKGNRVLVVETMEDENAYN